MKHFVIVLVLVLASISAAAQSPRLPPDFSESLYEDSLSNPTAMAFAPDGRLFVLQQSGEVRIITAGGTLLGPVFHDFAVDDAGERGLLGIAFDPDFASNNFIYFYYTESDVTGSRNRVVRLTANGNAAVLGSEFSVFQLPYLNPAATNHNGGAIHFGLDGKLYAGVGENADGALSQSMSTRLGKMLRYNADGTIPADNPFFATATGQNRAIWALGLRNPFTFAVQPGTGVIHINDVGQGSWEEINLGEAGANYGWPDTEGMHSNPAYDNPIYAYSSSSGGTCAITGGTFYNPAAATFPASYVSDYFFADLCANTIYVRDSVGGGVTNFATPTLGGSIVDLQIGPDGALYYLSRGSDAVYRIAYNPPPASGELVINGSFELDANGDSKPDGWIASPLLAAKRVCDAGAYITDGTCALRVKYGTGGGKIRQSIPGSALVTGTDLDISAMVTGSNVPVGTFIKVKVKTVSATTNYTLPVPSATYAAQPVSLPTITLDAQGMRVKVYIVYPFAGGKLYVDEMSVFATAP